MLDEEALAHALSGSLAHRGLAPAFIATFVHYYRQFLHGATGKIPWNEIAPLTPDDLVEMTTLSSTSRHKRGQELLDRLVVLKLNGGLGTTMALDATKSLIEAREGRSFLQLTLDHVRWARERYRARLPLLLMNSERTQRDTSINLETVIGGDDVPLQFLQHTVPRFDRQTKAMLDLSDEVENWAPFGHGDLYGALFLSGTLSSLLSDGYRWAFVSNSDNLAATIEPAILEYLELSGVDFAIEVTPKTGADIKGGILARWRDRLALIERTQIDESDGANFEDRRNFPDFNTNNVWWRLDALNRHLEQGHFPLPLIVNPKMVQGRDAVQLEIAMGSAVSCFDNAIAIRVPRTRFTPVKTTSDLLWIRSNCFIVGEDSSLRRVISSAEDTQPTILLDARFYASLNDFNLRFPFPVKLQSCRSLRVEGNVFFAEDTEFIGDVNIVHRVSEPAHVPAKTRFDSGNHVL